MHRAVKVQTGDIHLDRLGNIVGRAVKLDRVQHEVDRAALLHARRRFAVDDVDRDRGAHARTRAQAQEIDMHGTVGDDVELIVARQHPLLAAFNFEIEDRGQEVAGVDVLVELFEIDRNRFRFFAAAINDAGYAGLATNGAGGPLACPATRHGRELLDRCHVVFSSNNPASPPGVSETAGSAGL